MYDLTKADEIYNKMSTDEKVHKLFDIFKEKMPEEYCILMYIMEYGYHIVNKEMYDKAVMYLKWADDKGAGAKWTVDDIVKIADIDFDEKDYYKYDFAYVMNMLYSDYCNIFTETNYYIKMSKNYLEDKDYAGEPDERAYHNAIKRIKYFEK